MKRCFFCRNEIHTSADGHEIDHQAWCGKFRVETAVVYDEENKTYFIFRPDDPAKPYHPITSGAVFDLEKHFARYRQDWINENHQTVL